MNIEDINLGDPPTGAGGDTIRDAFGKTNQNFGAAKQALEDEVQSREQLLATQRDQLIALIESVNGPLPNLRADFKARSFGTKNDAGLFLPCGYSDVFSLTAPSPKWVWNAQGQLVEIPAGQPAWDHDPVTGEPLGQRVEAAEATTSISQSNDFTGAPWTATRMTVNSGVALGPDAEMSMTKLVPSTDDATHILRTSSVGGALKTVTIFARAAGYRYLTLARSSSSYNASFDLIDGVVTSKPVNTLAGVDPSALDATIQHVGNGIYRCSYTQGQASILDVVVNASQGNGGAESFAGNGVSGVEIFGINETDGAQISSYIFADGTAVTRAADVATIQNVDTAEWFNADAFTLYAEVIPGDVQNLAPAVVLGATAQDRVILFFQNGEAVAQVRGNQGITSISPAPEVNAGDRCRFAVSYRPGTAHISFNGVTQTVVNELDETPTKVAFGSLLNGTYRTSLALSDFRMMERALTAAELQELTS